MASAPGSLAALAAPGGASRPASRPTSTSGQRSKAWTYDYTADGGGAHAHTHALEAFMRGGRPTHAGGRRKASADGGVPFAQHVTLSDLVLLTEQERVLTAPVAPPQRAAAQPVTDAAGSASKQARPAAISSSPMRSAADGAPTLDAPTARTARDESRTPRDTARTARGADGAAPGGTVDGVSMPRAWYTWTPATRSEDPVHAATALSQLYVLPQADKTGPIRYAGGPPSDADAYTQQRVEDVARIRSLQRLRRRASADGESPGQPAREGVTTIDGLYRAQLQARVQVERVGLVKTDPRALAAFARPAVPDFSAPPGADRRVRVSVQGSAATGTETHHTARTHASDATPHTGEHLISGLDTDSDSDSAPPRQRLDSSAHAGERAGALTGRTHDAMEQAGTSRDAPDRTARVSTALRSIPSALHAGADVTLKRALSWTRPSGAPSSPTAASTRAAAAALATVPPLTSHPSQSTVDAVALTTHAACDRPVLGPVRTTRHPVATGSPPQALGATSPAATAALGPLVAQAGSVSGSPHRLELPDEAEQAAMRAEASAERLASLPINHPLVMSQLLRVSKHLSKANPTSLPIIEVPAFVDAARKAAVTIALSRDHARAMKIAAKKRLSALRSRLRGSSVTSMGSARLGTARSTGSGGVDGVTGIVETAHGSNATSPVLQAANSAVRQRRSSHGELNTPPAEAAVGSSLSGDESSASAAPRARRKSGRISVVADVELATLLDDLQIGDGRSRPAGAGPDAQGGRGPGGPRSPGVSSPPSSPTQRQLAESRRIRSDMDSLVVPSGPLDITMAGSTLDPSKLLGPGVAANALTELRKRYRRVFTTVPTPDKPAAATISVPSAKQVLLSASESMPEDVRSSLLALYGRSEQLAEDAAAHLTDGTSPKRSASTLMLRTPRANVAAGNRSAEALAGPLLLRTQPGRASSADSNGKRRTQSPGANDGPATVDAAGRSATQRTVAFPSPFLRSAAYDPPEWYAKQPRRSHGSDGAQSDGASVEDAPPMNPHHPDTAVANYYEWRVARARQAGLIGPRTGSFASGGAVGKDVSATVRKVASMWANPGDRPARRSLNRVTSTAVLEAARAMAAAEAPSAAPSGTAAKRGGLARTGSAARLAMRNAMVGAARSSSQSSLHRTASSSNMAGKRGKGGRARPAITLDTALAALGPNALAAGSQSTDTRPTSRSARVATGSDSKAASKAQRAPEHVGRSLSMLGLSLAGRDMHLGLDSPESGDESGQAPGESGEERVRRRSAFASASSPTAASSFSPTGRGSRRTSGGAQGLQSPKASTGILGSPKAASVRSKLLAAAARGDQGLGRTSSSPSRR